MEIVITKYTLIFFVLVEVIVLEVVLGILEISKRVGGAVIEWVHLRLRILL